MRLSPGMVSTLILFSGILILVIMVSSEINGLEDKDGDGINDHFQVIRTESDIVFSSTGELVEIELGYSSSPDIPYSLFMGLTFLIVFPVLSYVHLLRKERRSEREVDKRKVSILQENVRRISTFISITPSIPRAVRMSHVSQSGDEGKVIGSVIWNSRVNGTSIEDELLRTSKNYEDTDPWVHSSIDGLIRAQDGSDPSDIKRSCDLVIRRLGDDIRESMTEYSNSLKSPASALFAIGVLLPILLATMIPIAGLSEKTVVMVGSLLWVGVPYLIMLITVNLVFRRPTIHNDPAGDRKKMDLTLFSLTPLLTGLFLLTMMFIFILSGVEMPVLHEGPFPDRETSTVLLGLLGASLTAAGGIRMMTVSGERSREMEKRRTALVPDLLSEMGSHLMEGRSIEKAVQKGYERIGARPPLLGIIDGKNGDPVSNGTRVASDLSRFGGTFGGTAVKVLSKHLREMERNERSLKEMVRSNIGQMETTATIMAPIMIGTSVGIFELMGRTTSSVDGSTIAGMSLSAGDLTTSGFILLTGVYLLILSVATSVSLYRLEEGALRGGWKKVPRNVLLSSLMFTGGVLISTLLFGG